MYFFRPTSKCSGMFRLSPPSKIEHFSCSVNNYCSFLNQMNSSDVATVTFENSLTLHVLQVDQILGQGVVRMITDIFINDFSSVRWTSTEMVIKWLVRWFSHSNFESFKKRKRKLPEILVNASLCLLMLPQQASWLEWSLWIFTF